MHENRLYVFERTVPPGAPPPGLFQQSVGFVDTEGFRVRYETIYDNMHPPPPRVQYGQQSTGVPNLLGVPMGGRRSFTDGRLRGRPGELMGQASRFE